MNKGRRISARNSKKSLTYGDVKLLGCTIVFLLAVLLKYADFDGAQAIRARAAALVHGGADTQQVLAVLGQAAGKENLAQVFGTVRNAIPYGEAKQKTTQVEISTQELPIDSQAVPTFAEGGYSEELENREETIFPKNVDETNYIMAFQRVKPVEATIATLTSAFGARTHPIKGEESFHYGLDLAAPEGTPIGALADGTVRQIGDGSYGNYIIVDHADGFSTLYAHCSKILAKEKDTVKAGQEIAQVGATGQATGNHLHLEVWHDGAVLNPAYYVQYE